MKKGTIAVLALAISLIILSGCAQQNTANTNGQAQAPNESDYGEVNQVPTNTNGGTVNKVPTNVNNPNPGQPGGGSTNAEISIENFAFLPGNVTIKAGDTVTWKNNDSAPHTVTSDSGTVLQSESLGNGGTYKHMFSERGTYAYHCGLHPSMRGTITVQ